LGVIVAAFAAMCAARARNARAMASSVIVTGVIASRNDDDDYRRRAKRHIAAHRHDDGRARVTARGVERARVDVDV
jgi:hypothetical protein